MTDGRKIPRSIENPIDNVLIDLAEMINPALRGMGFTPNALTFCALVTGLVAAYFAWNTRFAWAAVFTFVSYQFDILDGNMARMFDMTTAFGDVFDHASDIIKYIALVAAIAMNPNLPYKFKTFMLVTILIFYAFSIVHMGCQEKAYDKKGVDSLSLLEPLCPNPSLINVTRWVGVGTNITVAVILLLIASVMVHKRY